VSFVGSFYFLQKRSKKHEKRKNRLAVERVLHVIAK
jgi:hypothetical protein